MQPTLTTRLRFGRSDGSVLLIDAAPLAAMCAFRQHARRAPEAGGVLLGRYLLDAPHVVVDEVTTPLARDRRWRTAFHREAAAHQAVLDDRWRASGGTCHYLGEWHTHPERIPEASFVDRRDWSRRLKVDTFGADSLFFIIVGLNAVRAWEGTRAGAFHPLSPLTDYPYED